MTLGPGVVESLQQVPRPVVGVKGQAELPTYAIAAMKLVSRKFVYVIWLDVTERDRVPAEGVLQSVRIFERIGDPCALNLTELSRADTGQELAEDHIGASLLAGVKLVHQQAAPRIKRRWSVIFNRGQACGACTIEIAREIELTGESAQERRSPLVSGLQIGDPLAKSDNPLLWRPREHDVVDLVADLVALHDPSLPLSTSFRPVLPRPHQTDMSGAVVMTCP